MSKKMQSNIMLLITAIVWGSGFVAQKAGAVLEPFTYNGIRIFIGGLFLIPIIMILDKVTGAKETMSKKSEEEKASEKKFLLIGGVVCGIVLCIASTLQQFGMYFDTDAGKTGFITSLYIVIVPILGIFMRKKVKPLIWFCVALGAAGFYLLCVAGKGGGFTLENGDFFVLLCAFAFSFHIVVVDYYSPKCDSIRLACLQFLVAGVVGMICMFIFETPVWADIIDCWMPILYAGIVSCGIGFTLQVVGQKHAEPAVASLIMSLESVFSVLFGVLLLSETLTGFEISGCLVIFTAVMISQIPSKDERLQAKLNK